MNITLDDNSPQFSYYTENPANSTWITNNVLDTSLDRYFDSTFHGTYTDGDAVELVFNGTAVYIYGAKRDNHGVYTAQLDGGNLQYIVGYANPSEFQQVIYTAAGLSATSEHTLRLTNVPSQTNPPANATLQWWFDVDYAVITTSTTGKVYTSKMDNTDPAIVYSGSGWSPGGADLDKYYNSTVDVSSKPGDAMSFRFNGSSVALVSAINTDHGNYTVSLDGQTSGPYDGTAVTFFAGVPLFVASNLDETEHQVLVTNIGGGSGKFDFDYAIYNSTIDPDSRGVSNSTGNSTQTSTTSVASPGKSGSASSSSHSGSSNGAAIGGGVAGGVVALLLLGLLAWFFMRRRKRQSGTRTPIDLDGGEEVKPYQGEAARAYAQPVPYPSTGSTGFTRTSNGQLSPSAREVDHTHTPFLHFPPPPPSNATSYPPTSPSRADPSSNPFTGGSAPSSAGSTGTFAPAPRSNTSNTTPPVVARTKAMGVAPPPTATPPFLASPVSMQNRRMVDGRAQDMGPMVHEEDEEHHPGLLPPDYDQATEPI
ncbi:hypothetical protein P7C73_g4437, partial [Tremellales sp. Uapishka_1]